jgi:RNA polymerase sigma-70 factor (ECF subfamily)
MEGLMGEMVVPESRATAGERSLADFDGVVRTHQKRIFRLLLTLLRDEDAAETLTQECFIKAYQARDRFRGDASVSTWLTKIAVNLARDHRRSGKMNFWRTLISRDSTPEGEEEMPSALDPMDTAPGAERSLLAKEDAQRALEALNALPEKQRMVATLRFLEDMDVAEIAESLSMKVGTVKAHLFRAVHTIRRELGQEGLPTGA